MNYLDNVKRVVVKVGTSTLTYESGSLNIRTIEKLVKVLADLKNRGLEIVLVSSGAVGVGMGKVGYAKKPDELEKKQALAAIGQCELMNFYDSLFSHYGHTVAQLLLTKDVIDDENRYKNAKCTLENLFMMSAIPIINENDPISTEQLEFGDNDTLSAYVAKLV
ncbi:MAG: glutamate 5-kinase, partial [Clostridia bacterium]|nr:glutamate 5-kinase [Clostridia bacterium]